MQKIGIALGGGGARGLAHVEALRVLDELHIRPVAVAGTSMGAIIGALYAAGKTAAEIWQGIEQHMILKSDQLKDILAKRTNLMKWLNAVRPSLGRGGILRVDGFMRHLFDQIGAAEFEDLKIPLQVIATDFWSGREVVFKSGPLLPAIQASMAVPGVFEPVVLNQQVLVDGGLVNNLPYDRLSGLCDLAVAVDVAPTRRPEKDPVPDMLGAVIGMFDLMVEASVARKLAQHPPALYVRPEIVNVRLLDFDKAEQILEQSRPAMAGFRDRLQALRAPHPHALGTLFRRQR